MPGAAVYQKSYSAQMVLNIIRTFNWILHLRSIVFPMDSIRAGWLYIDDAFAEEACCDHDPNSRLYASPLPQHLLMVLRQQRWAQCEDVYDDSIYKSPLHRLLLRWCWQNRKEGHGVDDPKGNPVCLALKETTKFPWMDALYVFLWLSRFRNGNRV